MRAAACAGLIAITLEASFSQSIERPTFAVASIKMYPDGSPYPPGGGNTVHTSLDGITARFIRFDACIRWAYDIPGLITGPDWIRSERLDITAKAEGPVPEGRLRLMLRALLADRFSLKLHSEMKELPVVALLVAKSGVMNLHPTETADPPELSAADGELVAKHVSLSLLASYLGNKPPYGVQELVACRRENVATEVPSLTVGVRSEVPSVNRNLKTEPRLSRRGHANDLAATGH